MSARTFLEIKLDEQMTAFAHAAVETPKGDMFEYGKACGIYAGLKIAKQLLLDTRKDAEDKEQQL